MGCASSQPADVDNHGSGAHASAAAKYAVSEPQPTKQTHPAPAAPQPPPPAVTSPPRIAAAPPSPPPKPAEPKQVSRKMRTDCTVRDAYKLGKTIGTGGFSIVKLAVDKGSGAEYACKIMALPAVGQEVGDNENTREDIFKEIDILCGLNHENVIFLKEYFEENNKVYLITELLTGGELLDAVLQRGNYTEAEARMCFVQLLRGIEYLHSKNVVHRDLKLENLLLKTPGNLTHVKIADFGLAKKTMGAGMQTICGTPQYVAPEVIVGHKGHEYGPQVDMWSLGVVLFILLGGYPPFWSESEPQLFEQIRKGAFTFEDPVWKGVSDNAKHLIRKLLVVDPTRRLTASQALAHPWIQATKAPEQSNKEPAPALGTQSNLKKHFAGGPNKFKAVVGSVIAANRMYHAVEMLKQQAASGAGKVDNGPSSAEELQKVMEKTAKDSQKTIAALEGAAAQKSP